MPKVLDPEMLSTKQARQDGWIISSTGKVLGRSAAMPRLVRAVATRETVTNARNTQGRGARAGKRRRYRHVACAVADARGVDGLTLMFDGFER